MSRGMRRAVIAAMVVAAGACDCSEDPGGGGERAVVVWQNAAQTVNEGSGTVTAALVLSAATDRDIEVPFTVGGTAVIPDDHDLIGGQATVPAGESAIQVTLTLVDDILSEGTEIITLTLGEPSFGQLGTPLVHTITVLDNEAALTVVSPNGGELWLAGDDETLAWTSRGTGTAVDVDYSTDAGATWLPIATNADDDGELTWTVPGTASTSALVRVSAGAVSDASNSAFEIRIPANRWFVDAAAVGDGTSWAQAFATVQESVAAAAPGDEIWVADGVYTRNGSDNAVLVMPSNVTMLGGFDGGESERSERLPEIHVAILDGEGLVDHVVIGASGALLDGFTVTGGEADGADAEGNGGGMLNRSVSSLMVRNCVFDNNHAAGLGGAVFGESSSGVLFENTRFANNVSDGAGGAMVNLSSQVLVRDCVVEDNTATGGAGGIEHRDGTSVIAGTVIRDNADVGGGSAGGVVTSGTERMTIVDSVLARNRGHNGGAVFAAGHELAVRRSLFYDNDAEVYGGAILAGGSSVEISSTTLVRNVTRGWAGVLDGWGGAYQIVNSIIWDNVAPDGAVFGRGGSGFTVSYSDLQSSDGFLDGGHNLNANPNFANADNDDFRLGQASPCIDAADGTVAFTVDALGQVRVDDLGMPDTGAGVPPADLGAFEFAGTTRLRLLTPNGGEAWEVGSSATVTWAVDGTISEVDIELTCDNGNTWRDVVVSTSASPATFTWDPIAGPGGPRCRVRVSDAADATVWDETDGTFPLASNSTWHVDTGVVSPGDGSTWASAYPTLPAAVAAASFGDEVRVAAGAYGVVTMKEGVSLLGGWDAATGIRDIDTNPTLLSGGGSNRVVVAADALIEGFLIEHGDASGSDGWDSYGGAMIIESVSPTVRRCTFRSNAAAMHGGALFITGRQAAPVIEECRFESNTAVNGGCAYIGQESAPTFVDTVFDGCSAHLGYGGAIGSNDFAEPSLVGCMFTGNHAGNGGALGFYNLSATATVEGCEFVDNTAEQNGGAVQVVSGTLVVSRSWFEGNDAAVRGGAIYLTEFGNMTSLDLGASVLVRNRARGTSGKHGGGGLYLANESTATLTNCTSFENTALGAGGAAFVHEGTLTVVNSILWDDSDASSAVDCPGSGADSAELFVDAGTAAVSYSDVADRCEDVWPGDGNIDADPLFADTGPPVDLHLTSLSPCIDIAHGDLLPASDYDGQEPYDHVTTDGNVGDPTYGDMGAFEYIP